MSERLKTTSNISNEEIIDNLTKNLKGSLKTDENVTSEECVNQDRTNNTGSLGDEAHNVIEPENSDKDFDDDENDDVTEANRRKPSIIDDRLDEDFVDEDALKSAEVGLTDDEKAERRIIAEELKVAGNNAFKDGEFERSAEKYTEGLKICPLQFAQQRAVLYCNRSASKMKMEKYKEAVKDCTRAIELDDKYMKAYIRRAQSHEAVENFDESLADFKKILELDPSHLEARKAVMRLPPLIEEKNEKLKQEMLGKLKDLGNMILKPFGLSTDNFKMEQDPESKGYKINFQQ